jgi:hypothetical protein
VRIVRIMAILLGYLAAWGLAALLVWLFGHPTDPASAGMQAFGDLLALVGLAGLLSLFPTVALVRELRRSARVRDAAQPIRSEHSGGAGRA